MHLKEELSKFFMAVLPCETASRIFCSWSSTKTTTPSCLQSSPLVGPAWSSFDHPMPKLQTEAVNMYPISLGSGNSHPAKAQCKNLLIQKRKQSAGRWLEPENLRSKPCATKSPILCTQTWLSKGPHEKKQISQLSQVTSSQKSWSCTSLKDSIIISIYEFFLWTNIDQHPWHWKNWNERLEIKEKLWLVRGF